MSPELVKVLEKDTYVVWDKPTEHRIFIQTRDRRPREGEPSGRLAVDLDKIEALKAKSEYENKTGRRVLSFHLDPQAGGLEPRVRPRGQVWKTARDFKTNAVIQQGNAEPGNTEMIAIPMWTGEYM